MKALLASLAPLVTLALPLGCSADDAPTNVTGGTAGTPSASGSGGTAAGGAGIGGAGGMDGISGTAAGGTGSGGMGTAGMASVSYARDIKPIFEGSCVYCHYTGGILIDIANPFAPTTGLVDSANTWAMAHPEANLPTRNVTPGNPDQSFIMTKIGDPNLSPSAGAFMPWNIARLTDDEVSAIRQWITAGALNDATYAATVQPIFGTPQMLGTKGGKCTYCHFPNGEIPNLADPFDPTTGAVGLESERVSSLKVIEPGNPDQSFLMTKVTAMSLPQAQGNPMPFRPAPLPAAEVALIKQWIVEGALNN